MFEAHLAASGLGVTTVLPTLRPGRAIPQILVKNTKLLSITCIDVSSDATLLVSSWRNISGRCNLAPTDDLSPSISKTPQQFGPLLEGCFLKKLLGAN